MTSNPIEELYNNIYKFAIQYRRRSPNMPYEHLLDTISGACGDLTLRGWNPELMAGGALFLTFTDKIMPLPETIINGRGESHMIERNHFIMQIFRIPLEREPTLGNLLAIAFYSGLLMANFRSDDFPAGIVKAYKDLNMHALVNFVERKDYIHIIDRLPADFNTQIMDTIYETLQKSR